MNYEILLTFKTPSVNKLQYTELRYMFFQRKLSCTVGNGITDYKTKCYLTKILNLLYNHSIFLKRYSHTIWDKKFVFNICC